MIILDTNVLSALMQKAPEARVIAWLDRQPAESVWITGITLFESRPGLALLPKGRRRQTLEAAFSRLLKAGSGKPRAGFRRRCRDRGRAIGRRAAEDR